MKRIVVSGGTGYIGRALVRRLVGRGDSVTVLTRGAAAEGNPRRVTWNPYELGEWAKALDGVDAVVNLVGEQAVGVRYTKARKRRIRESRLIPTENIVSALGKAALKPAVLVSASGINYYGVHPATERVDESFGPGDDFLARLCVDWEAASEKARPLGIRVINPRIAPVLGPGGGSLGVMALPFKLFVGGRLGSGEQGFSWIYLDDAIAALLRCIDDQAMPAKLNLCSPNPVSNLEASRAIAKALHRPSWLPVPAFALKLLFGEGAEPILTGQFAIPRGLTEHAPELTFTSLESSLTTAFRGTHVAGELSPARRSKESTR
jgi:uncharacterized protein (TIGR01777 family)